MRVGPQQEQVLRWACRTGKRFVISDVAYRMEMTYPAAESAVRKLHRKEFVELVRPSQLGVPNLYVATSKGRIWLDNFGGQ